jgi:integrase
MRVLAPKTARERTAFSHNQSVNRSGTGLGFCRHCRTVGVTGVSLHSYRYAWAQRALITGYPERHAQSALGHNSRAVHAAYAKGAVVIRPSHEAYEAE